MADLFCSNCGTERVVQHKFCGNCGYNFSSVQKEHRERPAKIRFEFKPNQQDIEIYKQHEKYLSRLNSFETVTFFAFFIAAIACFFYGFRRIEMSGFVFCIISLLVIKFTGLDRAIAKMILGRNYSHKNSSLKTVYNSLHSAQNTKNEPQCIYCGNTRFFRKGIYTSNDCTVNCTKCQNYLYTE